MFPAGRGNAYLHTIQRASLFRQPRGSSVARSLQTLPNSREPMRIGIEREYLGKKGAIQADRYILLRRLYLFRSHLIYQKPV